MSIKQTMSTPVAQDSAGVAAVVNEADDGTKAVLTELATKNADDSGFTQVSEGNPLPVTGAVQLTGRYVRESTAPRPSGKEGDSLFLWDTREVFLHDGIDWRDV